MYILAMPGAKPAYFSEEERENGLQDYYRLRRYFAGVSFHKISYNKFLKDIITGRTR